MDVDEIIEQSLAPVREELRRMEELRDQAGVTEISCTARDRSVRPDFGHSFLIWRGVAR